MSGEETVFIQTKSLTDMALKSNVLLSDIINGKNNIDSIKKLQKKASIEYLELSHTITSGAIAPNIIDDMLLLLNKEENILDSIFKISRQFVRYKSKDQKIMEYIKVTTLSFNGYASSSIKLLSQMHKADTINKIKTFRSRIKQIENEGDILRDSMLDFAYSTETDFKLFYHLIDLAYMCDDILDACEDASDIFLSIMLSITS